MGSSVKPSQSPDLMLPVSPNEGNSNELMHHIIYWEAKLTISQKLA